MNSILCVTPILFFISFGQAQDSTFSPVAEISEAVILFDSIEQVELEKNNLLVRELDPGTRAGQTFEVIGYINAPQTRIVETLGDFKAYPAFMPYMELVEILSFDGQTSVLNFYLSLPMDIKKKYRIQISTINQHNGLIRLEWQTMKWPGLKPSETIRETSGYWLVQGLSPERSLVLHHVYSDPGAIPFGLGWLFDMLTENSVPQALLQTRERCEALTNKLKP